MWDEVCEVFNNQMILASIQVWDKWCGSKYKQDHLWGTYPGNSSYCPLITRRNAGAQIESIFLQMWYSKYQGYLYKKQGLGKELAQTFEVCFQHLKLDSFQLVYHDYLTTALNKGGIGNGDSYQESILCQISIRYATSISMTCIQTLPRKMYTMSWK